MSHLNRDKCEGRIKTSPLPHIVITEATTARCACNGESYSSLLFVNLLPSTSSPREDTQDLKSSTEYDVPQHAHFRRGGQYCEN
ncbi:hypothetical protein AVEN_87063-1 [Araneus ventricosus]|uniref:Uncharacterized protein n=1 Tax=Araneus ventricosus TaxID=182803 RepID=A0A4Y2Q069_ARAVE|nr:hypothetical protein AVEN_87063-1 [Araneus ventricosus]